MWSQIAATSLELRSTISLAPTRWLASKKKWRKCLTFCWNVGSVFFTMNNTNKTYNFVQDFGHGWVEVPLKDVKQSGVLKDITLYSYKNNKYAYLEEDLDAQTFLLAMESKGYTITLNNKHIEDFETVINKRRLVSFTYIKPKTLKQLIQELIKWKK